MLSYPDSVRFLYALVHVHVCVVRAGVIFDWVLNELESGQADLIEGNMIGAARPAAGERGHPLGFMYSKAACGVSLRVRVDDKNFQFAGRKRGSDLAPEPDRHRCPAGQRTRPGQGRAKVRELSRRAQLDDEPGDAQGRLE